MKGFDWVGLFPAEEVSEKNDLLKHHTWVRARWGTQKLEFFIFSGQILLAGLNQNMKK